MMSARSHTVLAAAEVRRLRQRGAAPVVLEIGSDKRGEVASALVRAGAELVIASDLKRRMLIDDGIVTIQADGRAVPLSSSSIDLVVSYATLEHVHGIHHLLAEVRRVLRPGHAFVTRFGPVWSSAKGHHLSLRAGEREVRFYRAGQNMLPDWSHLTMSRAELERQLLAGPCDPVLVPAIVAFVHDSPSLNRLPISAYFSAIATSGLVAEQLELTFTGRASPSRLAELRAVTGGEDITCSHAHLVLRKAGGTPSQRLAAGWRRVRVAVMAAGRRSVYDDEGRRVCPVAMPARQVTKLAVTGGRG